MSPPDSFFTADDVWRAEGKMTLSGLGKGRYRLTAMYLFFEKGIVSTNSQQIPVAELYDIDVRQSMAQKAMGIGTISVIVHRPRGQEVVLIENIPNFREGQQELNRVSFEARRRAQEFQAHLVNTHRTENINVHRVEGDRNGNSTPPGVPALAPPSAVPALPAAAPDGSLDPIEQLRRLGELRDAGVITSEDFEAKKVDLLGRL